MGCRPALRISICMMITSLLGSCYESTIIREPLKAPIKPDGALKTIKLNKVLCDIQYGTSIGKLYGGYACVYASDLIWKKQDKELDLNDYEPTFNEVLKESNYPTVKIETSLFDDNPSSGAEILVGAILKELDTNYCIHVDGGKGEAYLKVEWQVFSARQRKVLYTATTSGSAIDIDLGDKKTKGPQDIAFGNALRNLLADPKFVEAVSNTVATNETTHDQIPVALVRKVDGSLSKEEAIAHARLSTLTLFAGGLNGSGFIISKDGYVLTCQHVVGTAKVITAKTLTGRKIIGEVVRANGLKDVALIKLESDLYQPVALGDTSQLQPATDVYAIGSPFLEKFGQSITRGIVSGFRSENNQRYIQSDVSVHPGNSGGPLITADGYVVGIASKALFDASGSAVGVNYFIPIEEALKALNITDATP